VKEQQQQMELLTWKRECERRVREMKTRKAWMV